MRDEFETQPIDLLLPDGTITPGELQHWEQGKDVWVTLICGDVEITTSGPEFWSALRDLRLYLEADNMLLICYGASRNVHPSGMSRDMGAGDKAYKVTLGQLSRMIDLVYIFDTGPDVSPVTVQEQDAFYEQWMHSIQAPKKA